MQYCVAVDVRGSVRCSILDFPQCQCNLFTNNCASGAGGKVVERFRLLGRAMAKALQDCRLLDIPLSYTFYRYVAQMTLLRKHVLEYEDLDISVLVPPLPLTTSGPCHSLSCAEIASHL